MFFSRLISKIVNIYIYTNWHAVMLKRKLRENQCICMIEYVFCCFENICLIKCLLWFKIFLIIRDERRKRNWLNIAASLFNPFLKIHDKQCSMFFVIPVPIPSQTERKSQLWTSFFSCYVTHLYLYYMLKNYLLSILYICGKFMQPYIPQ